MLALVAFNFMLVFVVSDAAGRSGHVPEDLEPAGSVEARVGAEHPGETVHLAGATAALVMGVSGLAGLIARPQRAGSATHVALAAVAWLLAAAVVGDPDNHGGQAGVIDLAFVVLALPALVTALIAAPWQAWRHGSARPAFLVAALVGLSWLWYGLDQGLMQRHTWPPMADPHHQVHWFAMSLLAWSILLLVAGAALPGRGWRVAAFTAGASAIMVAVAPVRSSRGLGVASGLGYGRAAVGCERARPHLVDIQGRAQRACCAPLVIPPLLSAARTPAATGSSPPRSESARSTPLR